MTLQEMRQERAKNLADARTLVDLAENDGGREMTAEEETEYDAFFAESAKIGKKIERQVALDEAERTLAASAQETAEEITRDAVDAGETLTVDFEVAVERRCTKEYNAAFRSMLLNSLPMMPEEEKRALQAEVDITGGFLVAPEQFVNTLIKAIDDLVFIRSHATVFSVPQAESLGVPTLDTDPADADWTAEILTGSEDSSMAFGKRQLHPHPLAKRIKISEPLLRRSTMPVESLVTSRLAYKFGITEEKGFLTGTGANEPLGIYTASADGISIGRDVSTDNTTTAITADGLINAKYSLKGGYWNSSTWNFHRDAMKMISKLKDGDGQYLWLLSLRDGEPDRILGRPVDMSEYTPSTFTTGLYVGMLGDFSHYWIADALDMRFQRLVELYAETNQVGFIGRRETDGMPVLEEAFARVTLA